MRSVKEPEATKVAVEVRLEPGLYTAIVAVQRQGESPADTIERVLGDVFLLES